MTKGDKERYRVQAAIAAMQAIIHSQDDRPDVGFCTGWAVAYADALIAELGLGEEE